MNRIICGAVLAAVVSFAGTPALVAERAAKPGILPPHEIITVVRSTGLAPLGHPVRRGNNYVLRARDEFGQRVRVVVDGRLGEVRSVVPVALGRRNQDDEFPYPSIYESGPPIYDRRLPIDSPPIIIEEDEEPPVYRRATPPVVVPPMPPEREALPLGAPPESNSPQILTAPRPPGAVPTSPPTAALPEAESENVLLPPPPPRFPQRLPPNVKLQQKSTKSAAKPNAAKAEAKKSESTSSQAAPTNSSPRSPSSNAPPVQLQD